MPIAFHCTECYAQVITPDETAGKQGRCTNCSAVLTIPHQPAGPNNGGDSQSDLRGLNPTQRNLDEQKGTHPSQSHLARPDVSRQSQDPFKPTGKKSTVSYSESVEKQFGPEVLAAQPKESDWGEDRQLEEQMEKLAAQELTRKRIYGAAQALLITGAISLVLVAIGIIGLVVYVIYHAQNSIDIEVFTAILWTLIVSVALMTSTMIVIGANHMLKVRSFTMAYTGVIFAILPLNPLFFLTIPFGISAMMSLNDHKLADGFKRR